MQEGKDNLKVLHGGQVCPACGTDLRDKEIPEESRQHYGGKTHFSRLIGVEYAYGSPERYDGVSEYQCPDCNARFGRWSGRRLEGSDVEKRYGWSEEMEIAGI